MHNILVIKLSAIGDVIHALPVAYAIKKSFPEVKLTWVVEPPAYDLVAGNPCIDRVILFEKKKFKSVKGFLQNIRPFAAEIRDVEYDAVLDLQGLFKSAVIAWLSKAPIKLGCADMREGSNKISRPVRGIHAKGHIVDRYLDTAQELGCRADEVLFPLENTAREAETVRKLMAQAGADIKNAYIVMAVGANWPNKRWPAKHYAKLADWLYNQQIIPVMVGGGVVDERLANEINAMAQIPLVNLVGRTTLKQLACIILQSQAVVGGDTGPVHLSAALQMPTVMLMGPTDPTRNGPYQQLENVLVVDYICKYCWQRQCRYQRDCLENISVAKVCEKLEKVIHQ